MTTHEIETGRNLLRLRHIAHAQHDTLLFVLAVLEQIKAEMERDPTFDAYASIGQVIEKLKPLEKLTPIRV